MTTPAKGRITEEIHTQIWVRWQVLRRIPEYQVAVKTFPDSVRALYAQAKQQRTALGPPPSDADEAAFTAHIKQWTEYGNSMDACQTVLVAYEQLSQWLHTGLTAAERMALEAMQGRAYAAVFTKIGRILAPCRLSKIREAVPLLAKFQRQWGIQFPLEPDIPYAIRPLLWSSKDGLVEWTLDDTAPVLHLTVQLAAPKKRIMDAIQEIVTHCLTAASPNRLQRRAYYEELFQIYDLHQAGKSDAAIARQFWPEEFKSKQRYGAKNPVLQLVHDRLKAVRKLMPFSPTQK